MIKHEEKLYHENGLCHLFSKVHQRLVQAMEGNMVLIEKEDIRYPTVEEVNQDEVFQHFKILQILGVDSIDDIEENDKGGNDDDDTPDTKGPPRKDDKGNEAGNSSKPPTTQQEKGKDTLKDAQLQQHQNVEKVMQSTQ